MATSTGVRGLVAPRTILQMYLSSRACIQKHLLLVAFTSSVFTNTTERKLIHTLRRSIRLSPRGFGKASDSVRTDCSRLHVSGRMRGLVPPRTILRMYLSSRACIQKHVAGPARSQILVAFTSSVFTNTTERKLIHTLRRSIRLSPRDWCGACRSSNASERLQILYVLTAPDCMSAAFPVPSLSSLVSNGISSDLYPSRKTPLVRATSEPHAEDTLQCFVAVSKDSVRPRP